MNKTFFFALAIGTAMASVACGDDTGTGGSADTSGSVSASGGTKTTTAGNTTTSGTTKATSASTGVAAPPCADECMGDAGCAMNPPMPGMACGDCVSAEADKGAASMCALGAATGPKCMANADCQAFVSCTLGGMMNCETMHAEGYGIVRLEVLKNCGNCGNGAP